MEVDDTPIEMMNHEMGDERFLKFLKKTVPLAEPKPRDMGANTFVSHFFDPPFDIEAFIGKMAKEKGIPFTQAEEEWSRSNLDKTHVGRYAHMLADDAVNGRPPSKEGTNPKEIAIYTAIYDYARNLVSDATDVESEVSLHADSAYVGGKFDLLMKKNGIWTLVDRKTNGEELDDIPTGKVGLDDLTKDINNNSYKEYVFDLVGSKPAMESSKKFGKKFTKESIDADPALICPYCGGNNCEVSIGSDDLDFTNLDKLDGTTVNVECWCNDCSKPYNVTVELRVKDVYPNEDADSLSSDWA